MFEIPLGCFYLYQKYSEREREKKGKQCIM